jgi:hypothetical protein
MVMTKLENDHETECAVSSRPKRARHTYGRSTLKELQDRIRQLGKELTEIDRRRLNSLKDARVPSDTDRMAMSAAVDAVYSFLCHHRVHSTALYILANALRELGDGVSRPEFKPLKACGRKEDSKSIVSLKGRLAGLGYAYMKSGMARDQAASQVARKIDREIAAKLCAKSLTAQIVKEWMVRYGGSRAPGAGGPEGKRNGNYPLALARGLGRSSKINRLDPKWDTFFSTQSLRILSAVSHRNPPPQPRRAQKRALSSAGERPLHTGKVAGSIPAAPTIIFNNIQ